MLIIRLELGYVSKDVRGSIIVMEMLMDYMIVLGIIIRKVVLDIVSNLIPMLIGNSVCVYIGVWAMINYSGNLLLPIYSTEDV